MAIIYFVYSFVKIENIDIKEIEQKTYNELTQLIHNNEPIYYNIDPKDFIQLKSGVSIKNMCPALDTVIFVVSTVYSKYGIYKPVVTSGNDSRAHMRGSAHYDNRALDFRTKDLPFYRRKTVEKEIKERLGKRYYVKLEDFGKANEHLHIQVNK